MRKTTIGNSENNILLDYLTITMYNLITATRNKNNLITSLFLTSIESVTDKAAI